MKRIIRVFPRRTNATPDDELAVCGTPRFFDEADEVHISVVFTYDKQLADSLATQWEKVAPVKLGGPAYGDSGQEFIPGMYVKRGYTITSRGCPNRCWFCDVWRREGDIRELDIEMGWNVLDSNLLACSRSHIKSVFNMLHQAKKEYGRGIEFTGGLEAKRLQDWHVGLLRELRPKQMFFAYDTEDDLDPLVVAGRKLIDAGWTLASKTLRCYVLCGYPKDTFDAAQKRIEQTMKAGFTPMAMLYRDWAGNTDHEWRQWQRQYARPAIMNKKIGLDTEADK